MQEGDPLEVLPVELGLQPDPDSADQGRSTFSWIPIVCSAVALVVAVGVGYSHLQLRRDVDKLRRLGQTGTVVVPEVRNLRVDEAVRTLRSVGLRGAAETSQGEVFAQEPGPGQRVPARAVVGLRTRTIGTGRCERTLHAWGSETADGLPKKGQATLAAAETVLRERGKDLREEYRATDSHIQRVPGRVWSRSPQGVVSTEAADVYVIVLTLASPRDCPSGPVFVDQGVPLSFVISGGNDSGDVGPSK